MHWWRVRRPWVAPILVWLSATAFMWSAITWVRVLSPEWVFDGFKIRDGSADSAWQTIRLAEMWSFGPSTLWWLHIYPPLYDGLRFLLMQPETLAGQAPDILAVDLRLYVVHSLLFGLTAAIVFVWVRDLTGNGLWAAAGAALWTLVPASLAYFVELNQTGLAIFSMALAFYLLYRFCKTRRAGYAVAFLAAILLVSLTRNVVQIHVIPILIAAAVAFWWMSRTRRPGTLIVNLMLVALIAFWPARAFVLYATFDVSTHTGYNRAGALWINPEDVPEFVPADVKRQFEVFQTAKEELEDPTLLATLAPEEVQEKRAELVRLEEEWQGVKATYEGIDIESAGVYPDRLLANATKLSSNWNTQETLRANYRLGEVTNSYLLEDPLSAIRAAARSLTITVPTLFRSISVQWYNGFNQTFPLSKPLDWVFSGWRFALLIALAVTIVVRHFGIQGTLNRFRRYGWFGVFWTLTAIPVLLSNRYWPPDVPEPIHSEADRLRALIDIPVYVLITFACFLLATKARGRFKTRLWPRSSTGPQDVALSGPGGRNP